MRTAISPVTALVAACLVVGVLLAPAAYAYQERIAASVARIEVTAEQQADFDRTLRGHYEALRTMFSRQVRDFAGNELEKQVNRGIRRVNDSTEKKMAKVLRPEQMEEMRYTLDLIARQFRSEVGIDD